MAAGAENDGVEAPSAGPGTGSSGGLGAGIDALGGSGGGTLREGRGGSSTSWT
jgi:hypothetical protein